MQLREEPKIQYNHFKARMRVSQSEMFTLDNKAYP